MGEYGQNIVRRAATEEALAWIRRAKVLDDPTTLLETIAPYACSTSWEARKDELCDERFQDSCEKTFKEAFIKCVKRKVRGYAPLLEALKKSRDDLTGKKVIVRNNEDEPLMFGLCKRYSKMHSCTLPVVENQDTGVEYICFGITIPFSEEVLGEISDLSPKEQWDLMCELLETIEG